MQSFSICGIHYNSNVVINNLLKMSEIHIGICLSDHKGQNFCLTNSYGVLFMVFAININEATKISVNSFDTKIEFCLLDLKNQI